MNMQDSNSIRKLVENFKLTHKFAGRILFDEPMKNRTSFKIGGNAPLFIEPANEDYLVSVLDFLKTDGGKGAKRYKSRQNRFYKLRSRNADGFICTLLPKQLY